MMAFCRPAQDPENFEGLQISELFSQSVDCKIQFDSNSSSEICEPQIHILGL